MKKIVCLLVLLLTCCKGNLLPAQTISSGHYFPLAKEPLETVVILPPHPGSWKELTRLVTEQDGLVEYIPSHQTEENWLYLIAMSFTAANKARLSSLKEFIKGLKEHQNKPYGGKKYTLNVIELEKHKAIYEYVFQEPLEAIPPQHELFCTYLTSTGFHSVGILKQQGACITEKEREEWIDLLKNHVSVTSLQQALTMKNHLSMANPLKEALDLSTHFSTYTLHDEWNLADGYTIKFYNSPALQKNTLPYTHLVTATLPLSGAPSLSHFLEKENKRLLDPAPFEVDINIIKRTPHEVIYTCYFPRGTHLHNTVVRIFEEKNRGYCSISYHEWLEWRMEKKEIARICKILESVKVR